MRERPVGFGTDNGLLGITCDPEQGVDPSKPAFLFLNAGTLYRVGPSRLHVRMARHLAAEGFSSLRFDFSGIGDSERPRSGRPFLERSVAEAGQAMDHLESRGAREFVLVGLCSGAEVAHATAVSDTRVTGIVPIDGHLYPTPRYYFHRYAPRLLNGRSWINLMTGRNRAIPRLKGMITREPDGGSPDATSVFRKGRPSRDAVASELQALTDRGVRMLHVFSGGLEMLCTYRAQFWSAFHDVEFNGLAEVEYLEKSSHTLTNIDDQRRLIERVTDWAREGWMNPGREGVPEAPLDTHVVDHASSVRD